MAVAHCDALAVGKDARETLDNIVLNRNLRRNELRLIAAGRAVADADSSCADVIECRVLNDIVLRSWSFIARE